MITNSQRDAFSEPKYGCLAGMVRPVLQWVLRPFEGTGIGRLPGARTIVHLLTRVLLPQDGIVNLNGHRIELHPADEGITLPIVLTGTYEEAEAEFIRTNVQPDMVVADVGANVGVLTLIMARATGERGHVYAFEPDSANLHLLERNIQRNGYADRVDLIGKAVTDHSGQATLFVSGDNRGEHTLVEVAASHGTSVVVETVTMDDYFEGIGIFPDFVKMDVQGAEVQVLRGMERMLARGFPQIILAEFWPKGLQQEAEGALEDILLRSGYRPRAITPMKCGFQNIAWTRGSQL